MRGITICALAWMPAVLTASITSGKQTAPSSNEAEAPRSEVPAAPRPEVPAAPEQQSNPGTVAGASQSGERKDLLTTDLNKYFELCKAQPFFMEKNGLAVKSVRKAFCLDLNLGSKYGDLIYSELNSMFSEMGLPFGAFLLHKCVGKLQETDNFSELFFKYFNGEGFNEDVAVSFNDNAGLGMEDQNRVRMILNGVYRKADIGGDEQTIAFEKFSVKVARLSRGTFANGNYRHIPEFVISAYPDVLLSSAARQYLAPLAGCFEAMSKAGVPKEVQCKQLNDHREIFSGNQADVRARNELMLSNLVHNRVYSEYHDFTNRMLFG